MSWQAEQFLILVKTYPVPSTQHREISCIAAVTPQGQLRRIFPVPFRQLEEASQFKRWEWITALAQKAPKDERPESDHVQFSSIRRSNTIIGTSNSWEERRRWLMPHLVPCFNDLETRRQKSGETLGVIRPHRIVRLEITAVPMPEWTEEEKAKLFRDPEQMPEIPPLQKLTHNFYYVYECDGPEGITQHRHKITDWSVCKMYLDYREKYGNKWKKKFRAKLEGEFRQKDLMFMMGTMHGVPDLWLIVGLFCFPKPSSRRASSA